MKLLLFILFIGFIFIYWINLLNNGLDIIEKRQYQKDILLINY